VGDGRFVVASAGVHRLAVALLEPFQEHRRQGTTQEKV
jgi:cobalamin-dependent methionine synthase I